MNFYDTCELKQRKNLLLQKIKTRAIGEKRSYSHRMDFSQKCIQLISVHTIKLKQRYVKHKHVWQGIKEINQNNNTQKKHEHLDYEHFPA